MAQILKSSSENYAKSLEIDTKQLERVNERMDKFGNSREKGDKSVNVNSSPDNSRQPIKVIIVGTLGLYAREYRKRGAERRFDGRHDGQRIGIMGDEKMNNEIQAVIQTNYSRCINI
ncbi:hypothetical protein AVEN_257121-1 [Araneus ventricosus]|uniref:Uncharacterized protein n=1 Tax=Araneus ventricosus TaxID=182803 RepID=A0A4Y2FRN0_ARAVE|nr:hypothetical protein AVEN_257121-1 [Araneus ventricosus]